MIPGTSWYHGIRTAVDVRREKGWQRQAAESARLLAAAIKEQPAPPCDPCKEAPSCAAKEMACKDFAEYVTPRIGRPRRKRNDERSPRSPTHEIYLAVMRG